MYARQATATAQFDDEGQSDVSCMKHQERTVVSLSLLRYYPANGTKPYSDGNAATGADQAWRGLYLRMGTDRTDLS